MKTPGFEKQFTGVALHLDSLWTVEKQMIQTDTAEPATLPICHST